ncbi:MULTISPECIES: hypothetical protein [unclassified Pseudomonas]|uniref:hypothetical protein n=1 Tax=unclassified Pseudomonas TaxID=196821 RepID=UPI00244A2E79|nr:MULTISPECIES: hypothetical protein [unclassified Pseudomonas]MDG9925281.1 hypothetical protein [Pseudomonas sp. GD04045]MDH0036064.1 hypothetical protein [Pseudomonas sp. GD04019]
MRILLTALLIISNIPLISFASDLDSDNLISAVRTLCLAGDEYQIIAKGDAGLSILKKGVSGEVNFSKRKINGITDIKEDKLKLKELSEIRACTQPHI